MNTLSLNLKNALIASSIAGTLLIGTTAQAATWTIWTNGSGDGQWENAANWSQGNIPDSGDAPIVGRLSTAGPANASTGTYVVDYLRVGMEGSQGNGTLNVSGADISSGVTPTRVGVGFGSGNVGIINLSGGALRFLSSNSTAASIGTDSGSGTVNQTGGTFSFAGGNGTSVNMGSNNGTGLYNFTAGTLEVREAFNMTTGGSGSTVFHVDGYDAGSSIQIGGTADDYNGAWLQGAGTTLSVSIDGSTTEGSTLISVGEGTNGSSSAQAVFESGSLLDLDFNSGEQSGTWTILSAAAGIIDNGLAFAEGVDTDVWSFAIVGNDLQVTAVPEPSAFALIMGGSVLLTLGRRRR
ncbi:PEP-CTERM sorting domain-containing protein [Coraliomargarita sp. SDUM461003]|uniref:PEP-CTERM sorting domain-containing protein n=1 Tax=Thalassobacterium maritimum TaxID=3041265 RepID=A0ABU1ATL4_9BACT|nr:PEP-CTERM sorting domain-containing protein [Coraliomargarita sp. SDUM461003]MDQ8206317.1 PEP-CTERM sorting domain-containing protein [Coraliomargarita sp. SDUM461003]